MPPYTETRTPVGRCAHTPPHIASTLGEVDSALCAEDGGVLFQQFYAKPLSRSRDSFSLRLGHAPALTVQRTVIHYRRAASLPIWEPIRRNSRHHTIKFHLVGRCAHTPPHIASALCEVDSALCAEDGGVLFQQFYAKPLSHLR